MGDRWRAPAAAAAAVGLLGAAHAACGRTPTQEGPPPRVPEITAAVLVAGGEGTLTGRALDLLPAGLVVDGHAVVPTLRGPTEVRFPMPPGRACEVDGRTIAVAAGGVAYAGRLRVLSTVSMEPGESRLLDPVALAGACLQLPAGDEGFVLTVLHPGLAEGDGPEPMLTVRTWTDGTGAPVVAVGRATAGARPAARASAPLDASPGRDAYAEDPEAFDPRYATARPRDTVRWVDFRSPRWYGDGAVCRRPKTAVPTFDAVVAAVSASGRTVIAYDARTAHPGGWTGEAERARLARLAEILDLWTLPALREVFGSDYRPARGGGGRWWHLFRTGVSHPAVDPAGLPRSMCPHYSEVAATVAPDVPLTRDDQVETVAGYLVHEHAHHAEDVVAVRRWGDVLGRGTPAWRGVGEAWAQTVQETAARLASGQPTAARYDALVPGSGVPYADFYTTGYGERPDLSPWGGGRGPYDHGTRLLMYLRERWGDATIGSAGPRFHSAVLGLPAYDFPSMARLAGLEPAAALDQWSLAEATDDLVDPGAAAARGLPQLRTWVPQDRAPLRPVSRGADTMHPVAVAPGGYAALYLPAAGAPRAWRGISLTFAQVRARPAVVRLTRLR